MFGYVSIMCVCVCMRVCVRMSVCLFVYVYLYNTNYVCVSVNAPDGPDAPDAPDGLDASDKDDELEQQVTMAAHAVSENILSMIASRPPSELLLKAVQRFGQRTQQASRSTSGVISFLHGGMVSTTRRGAIDVQPTATSRRRQALGRGSRRVGMGRPQFFFPNHVQAAIPVRW